MRSTALLCLIVLPILAAARAGAAPAEPRPPARRLAVLVGANHASPGRRALRYSYNDAHRLAEVLERAGDFAPSDVRVLSDPDPEEVLATLDDALKLAAGRESLLLFYYSGHADAGALYPNGKPLALAALRERLDSSQATVRVGIIDACRGGGWTNTKGLTAEKPFEVELPLSLASEGWVLIASSSGLENAHEAEALQGSFFTHHLVTGLSGAADKSGDGEVTVGEVFAYAKELTIRDSSMLADSPQHPSFDMNLRGRSDLVLTRLAAADSSVEVDQTAGPLQLVQLSTGVVLLESQAGERTIKLAIAPGRYLLKRRTGADTWAREVELAVNQRVVVREQSLELVGTPALASKAAGPLVSATWLDGAPKAGQVLLGSAFSFETKDSMPAVTVAVGRASSWSFDLGVDALLGITDRLLWLMPVPAFAYRLGTPGGTEVIPWAGTRRVSMGPTRLEWFLLDLQVGAGLGVRQWLGEGQTLDVAAEVTTETEVGSAGTLVPPNAWSGTVSLGYGRRLGERLACHLGLGVSQPFVVDSFWGLGHTVLSIGSVQALGLRQVPLVQAQVADNLSVDGFAALTLDAKTMTFGGSVKVGMTALF